MTRSRLPRALLPVLSLCLAMMAACSRETDDWRGAQAADTVAAYQQFIRQHPASAHAAEADRRAAQLVEDEDWRRTQEQDTLQAYQLFISQHPDSRWTQEARVRVETITLGSGAPPPAVQAQPQFPPVTPPPGQVTPAPAPAAAAPGGAAAAPTSPAGLVYGVQLGAFTSEAAAHTQWAAISARQAAHLGNRSPHVARVTAATGTLFRLQTPTRTEAEARDLCRALTAAGQDCVVVHP